MFYTLSIQIPKNRKKLKKSHKYILYKEEYNKNNIGVGIIIYK